MLINEMIIFYHVVQLKSFSQAALKLKVSKSHISKHITLLETELKVKLLQRSTRQLSLTEEGRVFFSHCNSIFEQAELGYDAVANLREQPIGTLKISAPPALALHVLHYPLIEFSKAYPEVSLNINLASNIENIIEQGYDLALRSGVPADSNLMAHKIGIIKNVMCASYLYLEKNGDIKNPIQLDNHQLAVQSNGKLVHELKFIKDNKSFNLVIKPYLQSNSMDLILQMVLSGNCIAILPEFMVKQYIQKQTLVTLLSNYEIPSHPLYAVYSNRKFIPLRVKMFVEFIKNTLSALNI